MYEELVFAPELEWKSVDNVNDALSIASEYTVTPTEVRLGDLEIHSDATIKNGEDRIATRYAFENLCKILGIPRPFARKIPPDLLFTNIERLKSENADTHISLLMRPNEKEIANIVKAPYDESSYLDVIGAIADKTDVQRFDIGEELLTIGLVFEDVPLTDEEDLVQFENCVYSSVLRSVRLHMISGMYRTSCKNSFIMPYIGKIKGNYLVEQSSRLLKFAETIKNVEDEILIRLQTQIPVLRTRQVFKHELVFLWKKISKEMSTGEADLILKLNEELRDAYVDQVHAWQVNNKQARLLGSSVEEPELLEVSAYNTLNDVTSYAQKLHGLQRRNIEKIAGQCIQNWVLN